MKRRHHRYYRFLVHGSALIPERFWNFGFTDKIVPEEGEYIIHLTRGVTNREAAKRMAGCKRIHEIIGDISVYNNTEQLNAEPEMVEVEI